MKKPNPIRDRQMREHVDQYATQLGLRPQSRAKFDGVSVLDITERVVIRAAEAALDAGFSGAHHDGGARALIERLKAWCDGLDGQLPDDFQQDCVAIQKEEDPEYEEYLRLQKKFE